MKVTVILVYNTEKYMEWRVSSHLVMRRDMYPPLSDSLECFANQNIRIYESFMNKHLTKVSDLLKTEVTVSTIH